MKKYTLNLLNHPWCISWCKLPFPSYIPTYGLATLYACWGLRAKSCTSSLAYCNSIKGLQRDCTACQVLRGIHSGLAICTCKLLNCKPYLGDSIKCFKGYLLFFYIHMNIKHLYYGSYNNHSNSFQYEWSLCNTHTHTMHSKDEEPIWIFLWGKQNNSKGLSTQLMAMFTECLAFTLIWSRLRLPDYKPSLSSRLIVVVISAKHHCTKKHYPPGNHHASHL